MAKTPTMREVLMGKNLSFLSALEKELKLEPPPIGASKGQRVDAILASKSGRTASGGSNLSGRGEELDRKMGIVSPSDAKSKIVGNTCVAPSLAAIVAQRKRLYGG
jgi:hypothetical protein